MSSDLIEIPVEVEVTPERYGTVRSVNVLTGDDIPPELDTQQWRLEEISVESYVRGQIDVRAIDKTTIVGMVQVETGTLEWEFIEN